MPAVFHANEITSSDQKIVKKCLPWKFLKQRLVVSYAD